MTVPTQTEAQNALSLLSAYVAGTGPAPAPAPPAPDPIPPKPDPAPTPAPPPPSPSGMAAKPASALFNSIGTNVHADYGLNWASADWEDQAVALGAPFIRTRIGHNGIALQRLQKPFAAGIKVCALLASGVDKVGAKADFDYIVSKVGVEHIAAFEGPNEYNGESTTWAAQLKDYMTWLHAMVKANPATANIPILAPSMTHKTGYADVGDISAFVDKNNVHFYSGWRRPTTCDPITNAQGTKTSTLAQGLKDASVMAPGKPIWDTEFGWWTNGDTLYAISELCRAKYTLRAFFDNFALGVEKSFQYSLLDDQVKTYGLLDASGNPRPSFTALQRLIALFKDTGTTAGSLDYAVSTAPGLNRQLFRRSDGTFLIALTRDIDSWDYTNKADLNPAAVDVILSLAAAASKIEVFEPTFGDAARQMVAGKSVTVPVADHVVIVKVTP